MRAAHALFMTLTVLILASALPLAPAKAFPSPFTKNAWPAADKNETTRSGRTAKTT